MPSEITAWKEHPLFTLLRKYYQKFVALQVSLWWKNHYHSRDKRLNLCSSSVESFSNRQALMANQSFKNLRVVEILQQKNTRSSVRYSEHWTNVDLSFIDFHKWKCSQFEIPKSLPENFQSTIYWTKEKPNRESIPVVWLWHVLGKANRIWFVLLLFRIAATHPRLVWLKRSKLGWTARIFNSHSYRTVTEVLPTFLWTASAFGCTSMVQTEMNSRKYSEIHSSYLKTMKRAIIAQNSPKWL